MFKNIFLENDIKYFENFFGLILGREFTEISFLIYFKLYGYAI